MNNAIDSESQALKRLVQVASVIAHGNYEEAQSLLDLSNEGYYPSEITELAEAIGMMLVKIEAREFELEGKIDELKQTNLKLAQSLQKIKVLENIKELLGNFVPEAVKREISADPINPQLDRREKTLTILFLDIAGFTSMTESTSSAQINFLIEHYFSGFIDVIFANHGEICESQGDGLMIVFETPGDATGHVFNAVRTAVAIQNKLTQINQTVSTSRPDVKVNIGIETGSAMMGSTRFHGVVSSRWTYTAYGMVVNLASRIGKLATNGRIYVSEKVAQTVQSEVVTRFIGQHNLKNVSDAMPVWEIVESVKPASEKVS